MTFNPEYKEPVKVVNDNQQVPRLQNRADDTQQEDSPTIKVTLYTVDNTILRYMSDRIKPIITQNGTQVKVPVIYGNPERWKSAQTDGIIRDSIGKIQLPVIMLRRTAMKKAGINSAVNKYYDRSFITGWNRRTPYDRFSVVNNITPSREYYNTTAVPDYYNLTYRCMVWTEYMEQMNSVIENISFESDEFWGERNQYKFRTMIDSFEPITELPVSGDRVVRTQFDMNVFAYLLPESQLDQGGNRGRITKKRYGVKKIVTFNEIDNGDGTSTIDDGYLKVGTLYVTADKTTVFEGESVTFTIRGTGYINDGTPIEWNNIGTSTSADFVGGVDSGSVILSSSTLGPATATVTLTVVSDGITDSSETIQLYVIKQADVSLGLGRAFSPIVTIQDPQTPQGELYAWGGWDGYLRYPDAYDNLGIGAFTVNTTSPAQVGSNATWTDVQPQINSTVALRSDGTLWVWGDNILPDFTPSPIVGLIGLGPSVSGSNTPTQIGTGYTWSKIAVGERFFVALRSDGTMWTTGRNEYGQLGLGDTTDRNVLTQIGSDSNWSKIFAGDSVFMAIKSNGTLWATGLNIEGQLAVGDNTDRSVLTQVGSDTNWDMVSSAGGYTMAIKTNGTLWAAGGGGLKPNMGLGAPTIGSDVTSFTQVGSDTNWSLVQVGSSHTLALKTDGTLWATGYNLEGQLGLGDTTDRDVFTQVGSDTWTYAGAANYASFGIKTNGTLWSWGYNNDPTGTFGGRLGLGDYTDRNVPTQIGSNTDWIKVYAGNSFTQYSVFGIRDV